MYQELRSEVLGDGPANHTPDFQLDILWHDDGWISATAGQDHAVVTHVELLADEATFPQSHDCVPRSWMIERSTTKRSPSWIPKSAIDPPQSACTRNVAGGLGTSLALRSKRSSSRKKSSAGLGKPQAAVLPRTGRGRDDEASRTGQTVTGKVFMGVDGHSCELWRDGSGVSNITTSHLPGCPHSSK